MTNNNTMKLVVLDFGNVSVNEYTISSDIAMDTERVEEFMREQGHSDSECEWMVAGDIEYNIN
jgi:hypothetical protein